MTCSQLSAPTNLHLGLVAEPEPSGTEATYEVRTPVTYESGAFSGATPGFNAQQVPRHDRRRSSSALGLTIRAAPSLAFCLMLADSTQGGIDAVRGLNCDAQGGLKWRHP